MYSVNLPSEIISVSPRKKMKFCFPVIYYPVGDGPVPGVFVCPWVGGIRGPAEPFATPVLAGDK
jgi:hypothetical protein